MTNPADAGLSVGLRYQLLADDLIADVILPPTTPNTNELPSITSRTALRLGDNAALRDRRSALLGALGVQHG